VLKDANGTIGLELVLSTTKSKKMKKDEKEYL
jgi:hypothetical protein